MEKAKRIKPKYSQKDINSVINKDGWELHFNQLYAGYCKKYNAGNHTAYIKGGWKLHEAFFGQFKKSSDSNLPSGAALELINRKFGTFTKFKKELAEKANNFHGSGWIYLTTKGELKLIELHKPETDIALIVDLWEHSFVQTFDSYKDQYFKGIWTIVDWDIVSDRIEPEVLSESNTMRSLIDFLK